MTPIFFKGFVEKGEGMASRLGCPTANISVGVDAMIPGLGVYVGNANVEGVSHPALVCVNDGREGNFLKLEVHLLDVCPDLTGKYLRVALLEKMRSLVPFESEEQISAVIASDIEKARDWFLDSAKNNPVLR